MNDNDEKEAFLAWARSVTLAIAEISYKMTGVESELSKVTRAFLALEDVIQQSDLDDAE